MAFELRDVRTIEAGEVAHLRALAPEVTDYVEGAVGRAILGAVAVELQRLDVAIYQAAREAIEVGTYRHFGFVRLPATFASGAVRYTRTNDSVEESVPLGHRIRVPGATARTYETIQATPFPVGVSTVDVPVRCQAAGAAGNTAAHTIVELVDALPYNVTVTNLVAFLTGVDAEPDDARRERFRLYIAGLSRGTRQAIEFGTRSTLLTDSQGIVLERVTAVHVREPFLEAEDGRLGLVEVYIDNGAGSASNELLAAVQQVLRGYKDLDGVLRPGYVAAGIESRVFRVTALALDVFAVVVRAPGFDPVTLQSQVEAALSAYLTGLQPFQGAIHAELVAAAMGVDGVLDVTFSSPTANVVPPFNQRVVTGVMGVTVV